MARLLVTFMVIAGLLLGAIDTDAKGGRGRARSKKQLINRTLVGARWTQDVVTVLNRSSYDRAAIEYAAKLWGGTNAPQLVVQHEAPTPCDASKPVRNVIILCDGSPWWEGASGTIAGFTANYAAPRKKKGKKNRKSPTIQASVIWLYPPRWTDEKILQYIPAHELGHALGLGEMTCECVMTPVVSDFNVLAPEEIAAVNAIYP